MIQIIDSAKSKRRKLNQCTDESLLVAPHPLNFDWRFSQQAISSLLATKDRVSSHEIMHTICLGTPSLAEFMMKNRGNEKVTLIDTTICNIKLLHILYPENLVLNRDILADTLPDIAKADIMFIDHHWRPNHFNGFFMRYIKFTKSRWIYRCHYATNRYTARYLRR